MNKTDKTKIRPTYQFGNTLYEITPIFSKAAKTEKLADKITRLILKDRSDRPPAA